MREFMDESKSNLRHESGGGEPGESESRADLAGELVEGVEEELVVALIEQGLTNRVAFEQVEGCVSQVTDSEFGHVDADGPVRGDEFAT